MPELEVQIDGRGAERGGNTVVRTLDRIRNSARGASKGLGETDRAQRKAARSSAGLGQAAGALAGALAIRKVFEYADAWTQVQNRIRLVTDSTTELNAVTEQVFAIAQQTRVGLASTADLYARIARSSDELGLSQQRVLDVTESVSKAITISGVSAQAADAAIVQLGQGLASGALRGDELRSVLEQTPRLARAIADGLGVPIGALRTLGSEGELTAEKVIAALESQSEVLEAEFGDIDVTVGQAFTTLENSVIRFVGRFGEATGLFSSFATNVQNLGTSIDGVGDSFFEAAFEVTQFVNAFAGGLAAIDERFALFQNSVVGTLASLFGDSAVADLAAADRMALLQELDAAENAVADGLDDRRAQFEADQEARKAALAFDLSATPTDVAQSTYVDPKAAKEAEKLRKELDRLGETLTSQVQTSFEEFQANLAEVEMALAKGVITQETYNRQIVQLSEDYSEGIPAAIEWANQLERGAEITKETQTPQELFIERQRELNELLGVGAINQETFNRALLDAQDELEGSITKNDDFAKFLEQVSVQAARNIQSAFADFLFDPFSDGLDGLLANFSEILRKMAAEALAAEVFNSIGQGFGAASGGSGGGGGGGFDFFSMFQGAFADGGDFTGGRPIVVGEEGPEIITPRASGTVTPNGAMGQAPAPNVEVPVTIQNITDPSAIVSAIESGGGQQAIVNAISQNPDAIKRALS